MSIRTCSFGMLFAVAVYAVARALGVPVALTVSFAGMALVAAAGYGTRHLEAGRRVLSLLIVIAVIGDPLLERTTRIVSDGPMPHVLATHSVPWLLAASAGIALTLVVILWTPVAVARMCRSYRVKSDYLVSGGEW